MLDRLMLEYNKTYHGTVGMSPVEARDKSNYELALMNTINKTNTMKPKNPFLKVGDKVRISRIKGIFEKGYLPNWSEEVFEIDSEIIESSDLYIERLLWRNFRRRFL